MFKALLTTLTATLATSLFAGDPSDWYSPEDYQPPSGYEATAAVVDARGKTHNISFTVSLDKDGNVIGSSLQGALGDINLSVQSAVSLIDETIKRVIQNTVDIEFISAAIDTLAENLTKVFMTKGLSVKIGDKSYNLKIEEGALKEAVQSGTTITHIDEDGLFHIPDEKSITRLEEGQIELNGWSTADAAKTLAESDEKDISLPVRIAKDKPLVYRTWNGIDKKSINFDAETKKLELDSWSKKVACEETLSDLLLSKDDARRASHHIVTRFDDKVHYLPIGEAIQTNGAVKVDDMSITRDPENEDHLMLKNFCSMGEGSWENPNFPMEIYGELDWLPFTELFSSLFEINGEGQITLAGIVADPEDPVRIMTVKAGDTGTAVTTTSFKDLFSHPIKMDDDTDLVTLDAWWDGNSSAGTTLADALVAEEKTKSQDIMVLARDKDLVLQYVPLGILAQSPPIDGKSITTNTADGAVAMGEMSLYGWADAPELSIPLKSEAQTLEWAKLDELVDGITLGITPDKFKLEIKDAHLQAAPRRYFGTSLSGGDIGWHNLPNVTTNYIEGDERTLTTVYNEGGIKKLGWKHLPLDVPSLAKSVGGEIQWLALELPTNVTITCDNASITTNKNNELTFKGWDSFGHGVIGKSTAGTLACKEPMGTNGVTHIETDKVLAFGLEDWNKAKNCEENLAELLSRDDNSAHEILTRFSGKNGKSSLHYLPLGKLTSAAGSATTYVGTDNQEATIGIGSTTNFVSFASAEDSNVEVKVTKENENTVKITIGVYYR